MAWPACPDCRGTVAVYDRAVDIRPAESEVCSAEVVIHPAEIHVIRTYRCPCGWSARTVERVDRLRPKSLRLRYKYRQPADADPSTESR